MLGDDILFLKAYGTVYSEVMEIVFPPHENIIQDAFGKGRYYRIDDLSDLKDVKFGARRKFMRWVRSEFSQMQLYVVYGQTR